MRFSVLLPTRSGGKYVESCIRSILEQDYPDFELVVSDNANNDETPAIVARYLALDHRMKSIRQETPVPVAQNWTAALEASAGDYILMMGDDDYLLPGALSRLDSGLRAHQQPDCVIYNGYSYVAPNAIAGNPVSLWSPWHHHFGDDFRSDEIMPMSLRLSIVRDMFHFVQRIPLNMQTTVFSRRAAERVRGGVFRPPFPDHYLLNALLIDADRWLYLADRLVVVGVSPKSFGHFFYSQDADAGLRYLGIETRFPGSLPGNELLNGIALWLMDLATFYRRELNGIHVSRPAYVLRQLHAWIQQRRVGSATTAEFGRRLNLLTFADWRRVAYALLTEPSLWHRIGRLLPSNSRSNAQLLWHGLQLAEGITDICTFAEWVRSLDNPIA